MGWWRFAPSPHEGARSSLKAAPLALPFGRTRANTPANLASLFKPQRHEFAGVSNVPPHQVACRVAVAVLQRVHDFLVLEDVRPEQQRALGEDDLRQIPRKAPVQM